MRLVLLIRRVRELSGCGGGGVSGDDDNDENENEKWGLLLTNFVKNCVFIRHI
jgi:hypothetical protein